MRVDTGKLFTTAWEPDVLDRILWALDWKGLLACSATCVYLNDLISTTARHQLTLRAGFHTNKAIELECLDKTPAERLARVLDTERRWLARRPARSHVIPLPLGFQQYAASDGVLVVVSHAETQSRNDDEPMIMSFMPRFHCYDSDLLDQFYYGNIYEPSYHPGNCWRVFVGDDLRDADDDGMLDAEPIWSPAPINNIAISRRDNLLVFGALRVQRGGSEGKAISLVAEFFFCELFGTDKDEHGRRVPRPHPEAADPVLRLDLGPPALDDVQSGVFKLPLSSIKLTITPTSDGYVHLGQGKPNPNLRSSSTWGGKQLMYNWRCPSKDIFSSSAADEAFISLSRGLSVESSDSAMVLGLALHDGTPLQADSLERVKESSEGLWNYGKVDQVYSYRSDNLPDLNTSFPVMPVLLRVGPRSSSTPARDELDPRPWVWERSKQTGALVLGKFDVAEVDGNSDVANHPQRYFTATMSGNSDEIIALSILTTRKTTYTAVINMRGIRRLWDQRADASEETQPAPVISVDDCEGLIHWSHRIHDNGRGLLQFEATGMRTVCAFNENMRVEDGVDEETAGEGESDAWLDTMYEPEDYSRLFPDEVDQYNQSDAEDNQNQDEDGQSQDGTSASQDEHEHDVRYQLTSIIEVADYRHSRTQDLCEMHHPWPLGSRHGRPESLSFEPLDHCKQVQDSGLVVGKHWLSKGRQRMRPVDGTDGAADLPPLNLAYSRPPLPLSGCTGMWNDPAAFDGYRKALSMPRKEDWYYLRLEDAEGNRENGPTLAAFINGNSLQVINPDKIRIYSF